MEGKGREGLRKEWKGEDKRREEVIVTHLKLPGLWITGSKLPLSIKAMIAPSFTASFVLIG